MAKPPGSIAGAPGRPFSITERSFEHFLPRPLFKRRNVTIRTGSTPAVACDSLTCRNQVRLPSSDCISLSYVFQSICDLETSLPRTLTMAAFFTDIYIHADLSKLQARSASTTGSTCRIALLEVATCMCKAIGAGQLTKITMDNHGSCPPRF